MIEQDVKYHNAQLEGPEALRAYIADLDFQERLLRDDRERATTELRRQEDMARRVEARMSDTSYIERIRRVADDIREHSEKAEHLSDRARVIAIDFDLPVDVVEADIRGLLA